MKKLFSLFVFFLIAATASSAVAQDYTFTYLPFVAKNELTPTPTPTATPTPTPTATPGPGAPPEITFFNCNYIQPYVYCFLDVKNVGVRPISDVKIDIKYDGVYARTLDSGSTLIQPDGIHSFSWNDYHYVSPKTASATIVSWVEH